MRTVFSCYFHFELCSHCKTNWQQNKVIAIMKKDHRSGLFFVDCYLYTFVLAELDLGATDGYPFFPVDITNQHVMAMFECMFGESNPHTTVVDDKVDYFDVALDE